MDNKIKVFQIRTVGLLGAVTLFNISLTFKGPFYCSYTFTLRISRPSMAVLLQRIHLFSL